jgi:hypothetical protein
MAPRVHDRPNEGLYLAGYGEQRRCNGRGLARLAACCLAVSLAAFGTYAWFPASPAQAAPSVIQPYYVYPSDLPYHSEYVTAINSTMTEIKNWYQSKTNASLQVLPAKVAVGTTYVQMRCGPNPDPSCASTYNAFPNTASAWLNALFAAVGGSQSGVMPVFFAEGGGGVAGGNVAFAMVGDWTLESISGVREPKAISCADPEAGVYCTGGYPKGTVAHEMGHGFGLPHPDPADCAEAIMSCHGNYPNTGFLPTEVAQLRSNAFFTVLGAAPPINPAAPTGTATAIADPHTVKITWQDNSMIEDGYDVYDGATHVRVGPNNTSYYWGGYSAGTYKCFNVYAYRNDGGRSAATPYSCLTLPTIPAAPSGLGVGYVNGTSIRISWLDNSNNETGFDVSNGVSHVQVGANTSTYTWGGLSPGTYMCFQVAALNAAGTSAYTPWGCSTTPTIPAAPSGLTATAISSSSVRLNWRDNSNNETGFRIYNGVTNAYVNANTTTYTWPNITPGSYMCFSVVAYNAAGSSAATPYSCLTLPK